ncbi:MAG: exo-alpha-sialidase [Bacteroidaceae bacterium]|nr:exo-alpha-sialidase [Bacteroidaceae bacterium]
MKKLFCPLVLLVLMTASVWADSHPVPHRTTLFSTLNGGMDIPPYRIPGITCGMGGWLVASAARLVCGTDPGFGQVDCVVKISDDNGLTWSDREIDVAVGNASLINNVKTPMEAAYGDPAVVMDREHNEVLVMAVAGCIVFTFGTTNRRNPSMIAAIRSLDGGETWQKPVDQTEDIYSLFDKGSPLAAAFVGGGRIFQSRIVKVGEYYRLYAALAARPNGNRVIYSDDFGRTWKALGGVSATPVPNGDEPKCEELPDGRVIITSRVGGGRLLNIYTYTNTRTGKGRWDAETKATMGGLSASPSSNPINGEMLIVPAKRISDGKLLYVALQSVPTGSGRNNVGIFYKELAGISDIRNPAAFSTHWNGFYQVSRTASAYSSMELQADDRIAVFYEETLTKWGTKPNPVSTSFPTGAGTHNFDGFENIYLSVPLEVITDGKYSVSRQVNRGEYLKSYFIAAINESGLAARQKATARAHVASFPAEPTADQIDTIYTLLSSH